MAREKPTIFWGCDHHYPIEVVPVGGGKLARCLGCGACGPVRAGGEDAMLALRTGERWEPNPPALSSPKRVKEEYSELRLEALPAPRRLLGTRWAEQRGRA
jgi:hypothetical protein